MYSGQESRKESQELNHTEKEEKGTQRRKHGVVALKLPEH